MILPIGKYYVYRHTRLDKGEPFYIGVGKAKHSSIEYEAMYYRAFTKSNRNKWWYHVVDKCKEYSVEIIFESNDEATVLNKEIYFIKLYGKAISGDGTLVNLHDGGGTPPLSTKESNRKAVITNIKNGHYKKIAKLAKERIEKHGLPYGIKMQNELGLWRKKVYLYNQDGTFYKEFPSLTEAANYFKFIDVSWLCKVVNSNHLLCKGKKLTYEYLGEKINPFLPSRKRYKKNGKPIYWLQPKTKIATKYISHSEAAMLLKLSDVGVSKSVKLNRPIKGHIFSYECPCEYKIIDSAEAVKKLDNPFLTYRSIRKQRR